MAYGIAISLSAAQLSKQMIKILALFVLVEMSIRLAFKWSASILINIQIGTIILTILFNMIYVQYMGQIKQQPPSNLDSEDQSQFQKILNTRRPSKNQETTNMDFLFLLEELPLGVIILNKLRIVLFTNKMASHYLDRIHTETQEVMEKLRNILRDSLNTRQSYSVLNPPSKIQKLLSCSRIPHQEESQERFLGSPTEDPFDAILKKQKRSSHQHFDLGQRLRYQYLDVNEKKKYLQFQVYQQLDDNIIILMQDVTDRVKKQDQKLQYKFQHQLLNSFSHELRTPLNCSQQLLDTLYSQSSEYAQEKLIKPIMNQNELLLNQINDILDFAAIESDNFSYNITSFNLKSNLNHLKDLYQSACEQKSVTIRTKFKIDYDQVVNDQRRLLQVIINLLNNAVKFTFQGGVIVIQAKKKFKNLTNLIKIKVKDTGIGMSIVDLNNLNGQLAKSENKDQFSSDSSLNVGLGIKVANILVKGFSQVSNFKNNLKLKSEENRFTHVSFFMQDFQIDLTQDSEEFGRQRSVSQQLQKMGTSDFKFINQKMCGCIRILIVDDIPFNHQALVMMLNELHHKPDQAFDGYQACQKVKEKLNSCQCHPYYQIILMDIEMPRMNGFDASLQIKHTLKQYANMTKIIMCSAYDSQECRELAKKCHIDGHLPKPVSKANLLSLLQKYIT
ncbi:hypothetical protein pb186bvf_017529 [Paramecium bursaria]